MRSFIKCMIAVGAMFAAILFLALCGVIDIVIDLPVWLIIIIILMFIV